MLGLSKFYGNLSPHRNALHCSALTFIYYFVRSYSLLLWIVRVLSGINAALCNLAAFIASDGDKPWGWRMVSKTPDERVKSFQPLLVTIKINLIPPSIYLTIREAKAMSLYRGKNTREVNSRPSNPRRPQPSVAETQERLIGRDEVNRACPNYFVSPEYNPRLLPARRPLALRLLSQASRPPISSVPAWEKGRL